MNSLNKRQEKLRGKKIADMNQEERLLWIDTCDKMENWLRHSKARRSWMSSREDAKLEYEKRTGEVY